MNNERNNLVFDFINILSFAIGIENLQKNNEQIQALEEHLNKQDAQYDKIISLLENLNMEEHNGRKRTNNSAKSKNRS